jgi:DNA-binding NarL/FixJ family response regulator
MRSACLAACFAAFAAAAVVVVSVESHAAGALATGRCGAYGYSADDLSPEAAAMRARAQCKGKDCKVVASFRRTCAAFAIDAKNACGPTGWAKADSLARAQNIASAQCHRFGGETCVIRAWVCDARG